MPYTYRPVVYPELRPVSRWRYWLLRLFWWRWKEITPGMLCRR